MTSQAPDSAPTLSGSGRSLDARGLDAQRELLPYALGLFALGLPVFVWAGAYAADSVWMSALFVQFSVNWGAFYGAVNWLRGRGPLSDRRRGALHIVGGLLWVLAVAELSAFGWWAGPVRDVILAIATAAAAACIFFSSPYLKSLLVIGPLAAASPLLALWLSGDTGGATIACGALALAMALCMIVNRILRRQFSLATDRERLMEEHDRSLGEAERLAKSKSQLLATLSHEIRNGLTGVAHVLAAAAGTGGRAQPSRDQLAAALAASHELLDVLNATLDTETAGAGKLSVAPRAFDAASLTRSTVLLCRPRAVAKSLELDLHVDEALGTSGGAAIGDPVRVRQILSNLIGNALKYTARGRVEVRVQRQGADRLRIEVADTGPGLSAEEVERAFQPFSRIERVGLGLPGAGLGLSLSRELARLMGGEVAAESAVGVGSRFWVDLPFDPAATAHEDGEPHMEMVAFVAASPSARSMRVLVAEDDPLNAAMLRAVLEQLGHQVVHAHDGARALELAEFCQFDLIMLDGRMPQLTGAEAARGIRALAGAAREAPIVAVIGGDAEEAQACLDAGADQVLRKPVTVTAVARAVAAAVRREPSQGPSPLALTAS